MVRAQGEHPSLPTPLVISGISLMIEPRNLHLQEKGRRRWRDGRKETVKERGGWEKNYRISFLFNI